MDFEKRMSMVQSWLKNDIFTRFTPPTGIDKNQVAKDIAAGVNANLPRVETVDHFKFYLEKVGDHVVRTARSRTLPIPKDFIEGCRHATKSAALQKGMTLHQDKWEPCPYRITEKRVRNGEAISDVWLSDYQLERLLERTNLTMEDMRPYIVAHKQEEGNDNNEENGIHRW